MSHRCPHTDDTWRHGVGVVKTPRRRHGGGIDSAGHQNKRDGKVADVGQVSDSKGAETDGSKGFPDLTAGIYLTFLEVGTHNAGVWVRVPPFPLIKSVAC